MVIALKPLLLYLGSIDFIWLLAGGMFTVRKHASTKMVDS